MGVSIRATNSSYSFDMGFGGFFNLRKNIALALDDEFGKNYANLAYCHSKEEYAENDRIANEILARNPLDEDILAFLYDSDTTGQISHKVCKKIYNLIQDIDFGKKCFRYGAYAHNDYEEFKAFLKECYSNRRYMRWF